MPARRSIHGGVPLFRGQNGRLALVGRPGDRLSVGLTSIQCAPVTGVKLSLLDPAGKTLATGTAASAGTWVLPMLTSPGTHQIWIQPSIPATCSIALAVSPVVEGSLPADGSVLTHQTGRAGQTARYTFSASAGESYTIQATVGNTYSKGVALTVNKPDGTGLASMTVAGGATGKLNLPNLPSTGSYVVALAPVDASAGAVDLRFVPHAVGTLAPGDLEKTLVLGVAQNGRYTFAGVAGDSLALTYTGVSTAPSGQSIALTVVRPEGTALQSISVSAPGSTQLTTLPVSGTYVLTAAPAGVSAASLTLMLSRPVTGTITPDGSTTRMHTDRPGQAASFAFDAMPGYFTVHLRPATTFTANAIAYAYAPSGAQLTRALTYAGKDNKMDLGHVTQAGTYQLRLVPNGLGSGDADARIIPYASGALSVGAAPAALSLAPGQNGVFTFPVASGDALTLSYSSFSTAPAAGTVTLSVYDASGKAVGTKTINAAGAWALPTATSTGTFTLVAAVPDVRSVAVSIQITKR